MRSGVSSLFAVVLGCAALASRGVAQTVVIAPQIVVIDAATRTTSVTLVNTGNVPNEVTFSTEYGYPVTDANGVMSLKTLERVTDTAPNAASWIQIFPQRLRLAPNERKVVRLLVTPSAKVVDREYWARLVVTSRGGSLPVAGVRDTANVKIGLNLEVRANLPVFYRKGKMTTGVTIGEISTAIVGDSLVARPALTRTGNAAFMGSLKATLRESGGKIVSQSLIPMSVFYSMNPRIAVAAKGLKRGKYDLIIEAISTRASAPPKALLSTPTVKASVPITIP